MNVIYVHVISNYKVFFCQTGLFFLEVKPHLWVYVNALQCTLHQRQPHSKMYLAFFSRLEFQKHHSEFVSYVNGVLIPTIRI